MGELTDWHVVLRTCIERIKRRTPFGSRRDEQATHPALRRSLARGYWRAKGMCRG